MSNARGTGLAGASNALTGAIAVAGATNLLRCQRIYFRSRNLFTMRSTLQRNQPRLFTAVTFPSLFGMSMVILAMEPASCSMT